MGSAGLSIMVLASCGRTISRDGGADGGAQGESGADAVTNGMEDGTNVQRDALFADAPDDPLVATTDVAPWGLDAAFGSASDTDIAEAGRPLDLASLDGGPDVWPSQIPSRQSLSKVIGLSSFLSSSSLSTSSISRKDMSGETPPTL